MGTSTEIICFTDLQGSTALTEKLGNQAYKKLLDEHLRLGELLASRNKGKYVKNMGDAHMIRFSIVEDALAFALQLQEACTDYPAIIQTPIPVRVSLFQGSVVATEDDVYGSGVNQAARLQSVTDPNTITLNDALFESVKKTLGPSTAQELCVSLGARTFKGVIDPPEQEIYSFDYLKYRQQTPLSSLCASVFQHLRAGFVEPSNLTANDLLGASTVIWPVVPRDLATAIHRGQLEVIRLLAGLGFRIQVLVADCGGEQEYDGDYVRRFVAAISRHATQRGIKFNDVTQMSHLYDPGDINYRRVQDLFRATVTAMSVDVLMSLNQKGYSDDEKTRILQKPALTHLRPALTLAAVLFMAEASSAKCVVVSGADERLQWDQAYNLPNGRTAMGVLMIPVIKTDRQHQMLQQRRWPIWHSEEDAVRDCLKSDSNVADWLLNMLARLPAFPDSDPKSGVIAAPLGAWLTEDRSIRDDEARALVSHIWPILNSA